MHEHHYNEKKQIKKAFFGIFVVLGLIAFFVFYKDSQVLKSGNQPVESGADVETLSEPGSKILQNHLELLDKIKDDSDFEQKKAALDETLIKTLEQKTELPVFNQKPLFISETFDKQTYQKEFLETFARATTSGMGLELYYFISQISPESGEVLPLSPEDKESMRRVATEYEIFGTNIQKLKTPTGYVQIGSITTQKAFEIAHILRQMLGEKDTLVYSTWFEKYSDASNYIYKKNAAATSTTRIQTSSATNTLMDDAAFTKNILETLSEVNKKMYSN